MLTISVRTSETDHPISVQHFFLFLVPISHHLVRQTFLSPFYFISFAHNPSSIAHMYPTNSLSLSLFISHFSLTLVYIFSLSLSTSSFPLSYLTQFLPSASDFLSLSFQLSFCFLSQDILFLFQSFFSRHILFLSIKNRKSYKRDK